MKMHSTYIPVPRNAKVTSWFWCLFLTTSKSTCFQETQHQSQFITHVTSASGSTLIQPLPTRFLSSSFNAAWYPSSPNSCNPLRNLYCGVDNDALILKYVCIMFAPSCCSMNVVCAAEYLRSKPTQHDL